MTVCSRDPYPWNANHFIRWCCLAHARAGMQGEQGKALFKSCLKAYPFWEITARNTQALAFLLELGSSFVSAAFICNPGIRAGGRRPKVQAKMMLELSVSHCHFIQHKWLCEDKEQSFACSRGNILMHELIQPSVLSYSVCTFLFKSIDLPQNSEVSETALDYALFLEIYCSLGNTLLSRYVGSVFLQQYMNAKYCHHPFFWLLLLHFHPQYHFPCLLSQKIANPMPQGSITSSCLQ